MFPQDILESLLQLDGSGDVSSHPADAQLDHSASMNSTSVAGSSHEILLLLQSFM